MRYHQVGCYGNPFYETPNIDSLSKEGLKFTNAYTVSPICSPARVSILTGKPPRLHLTTYTPSLNWSRRLVTPNWKKQLDLNEITLAEGLKSHRCLAKIYLEELMR